MIIVDRPVTSFLACFVLFVLILRATWPEDFAEVEADADADAVVVWPLGDSITQGKWSRPPYRPYLWRDAVRRIHFVGTNRDFSNPSIPDDAIVMDGTPEWVKKIPSRELAHNGYSGWTTAEVLEILDDALALLDTNPEAVLLHLGTNDLGFKKRPTQEALHDLGAIVVRTCERFPQAHMYVAAIIPSQTREFELYSEIAHYNEFVRNLSLVNREAPEDERRQRLEQLQALRDGGRLHVVDHYRAFMEWPNYEELWADEVHPGAIGNELMARVWLDALREHFGARLPPPP